MMQAANDDSPLYFVDATHPAYTGRPAHGWMRKGLTRELRSNHGRVHLNINGALCWHDRSILHRQEEKITSAAMIALLEEIAARHPTAAAIQRILALPDETRLFTGHDYCPAGRKEPLWESTVAQQRAGNIHLTKAKTEEQFVALREKRDKELPMPKLILHSLQVNIRGGRLPEAKDNGKRYLKLPLDALAGAPWDE